MPCSRHPFPFVLLFSFFFHIIQVLVSAGIALICERLQTDLNYKALIRLSAVSFTPALILQTVHALLDIPFPYRTPVSFLISWDTFTTPLVQMLEYCTGTKKTV
jgi:hypothetical protein